MVHLSIIIPAYNEERRIPETLDKIHDFLNTKGYTYEVIVVDDGSTDRTVEAAEKNILADKRKLRVIKNGSNKGKGFSVRKGILSSAGEYILFSDADLSTPMEELDKFLRHTENGYDIVIGSRAIGGSEVKIHQPWYREMMGKTFNLLIKIILLKDFHDTQCGYKLFKSDAARKIAGDMKIEGFAFDVEMLYLAKKYNYHIMEAPVVWRNSAKSKVNPVFDSSKMFLDIIKIKRIHG